MAVTDKKDWDKLRHGIHMCAIYSNRDEQFSPILSYFWSGFDKFERCMYFYDENPPENFPSEIRTQVGDSTRWPMEVFHYTDIYTKFGSFDPDKMIRLIDETLEDSCKHGFTGIRAVGEMSWVMKSGTPIEKYYEYENKLNDFYPYKKVIGICQFDENKFSEDFLAEMIRTHPYLLLHGKLYQNHLFYTPPDTPPENAAPHEDYQTMVKALLEEEPLIA